MESGSDFSVHKNVLNIPEGLLCELKTYLPEGYRTLVTSFNELPSSIYEFVLRLNIRSKEEALKWLACYKEKSLTSWNIYSTFKSVGKLVVFKINFLCHHNTRAKEGKTPSKKHTNCPARLNITVKYVNEKSRSKDVHLKERPCEILLGVSHNHSINSAAALKYRKPSKRVVAIFEDLLLCKGHTPPSALKAYKLDLQLKHGDNYSQVAADGSICPSLRWVYHLQYKLMKNGSYDDLQPSTSGNDTVADENVDLREAEDFCDETYLEIYSLLKPHIKSNPLAFKAAFVNAKKCLQECKSQSEILSVFHNLGKTSGTTPRNKEDTSGATPINKEDTSGATPIKKRKNLQGVVTRTVQPTASDKSECSTGRYEMREHNYAACKSRTRNAPHSISVCVDNNLLYSIENSDKNIQFL